jgi:hypothetical protein
MHEADTATGKTRKPGNGTAGTSHFRRFVFRGIRHPTAFVVEAGAQCSQSPITTWGGR